MSALEDITIPLEPDHYYHIFNQGNNKEIVFFREENHTYFLKQLNKYMSGYFYFYAYCLIPNHFHILIRVKPVSEIFKQSKKDFPKRSRDIPAISNMNFIEFNKDIELSHKIVSEKFRRFFLSYAKAINKQVGRTGSLFRKNFRRKKINSDDYFTGLVWYIHNNPVKHKIYNDYKTYKWSSYKRILMEKPSSVLEKEELFSWFGDKQNYIDFHEMKKIDWDRLNGLIIEDE